MAEFTEVMPCIVSWPHSFGTLYRVDTFGALYRFDTIGDER